MQEIVKSATCESERVALDKMWTMMNFIMSQHLLRKKLGK